MINRKENQVKIFNPNLENLLEENGISLCLEANSPDANSNVSKKTKANNDIAFNPKALSMPAIIKLIGIVRNNNCFVNIEWEKSAKPPSNPKFTNRLLKCFTR